MRRSAVRGGGVYGGGPRGGGGGYGGGPDQGGGYGPPQQGGGPRGSGHGRQRNAPDDYGYGPQGPARPDGYDGNGYVGSGYHPDTAAEVFYGWSHTRRGPSG